MHKHKRTIICFSHLNWNWKLFQRPQQLMLRFSKDFNVLYINDLSVWQFFRDKFFFFKEKLYNFKVNENLIVYSPFAFPTFRGKFSLVTRFNKTLLPFLIRSKLKKLRSEKSILWIYHPRYLDVIGDLNEELVVYDCMDDFTSLHTVIESTEEIVRDETELLKRADLVFAGGYSIAERKKHIRGNIRVFPSAVEVDHFKKALLSDIEIPNDIRGIPHPILGYWGAIDERIDHRLLEELAIKHPDWSIVLLGPLAKLVLKDIPYLKNRKNVFWLGPKDYATLPNYARIFDVCLNPFVLTKEGIYLSPTKTLEYLATGKPVVSTPITDIVRFYGEVVQIANGIGAFETAVKKCIEEDNVSMKQKRINFTESKTWECTVEDMRKLILDKIEKKSGLKEKKSVHVYSEQQ